MKEELDYSPGAKPLYAQLHDILLGKLKAGEYKKNDVLPTEAEFEEIFGVSRITARRALAELDRAVDGLDALRHRVGREVDRAIHGRGVGSRLSRRNRHGAVDVLAAIELDAAAKREHGRQQEHMPRHRHSSLGQFPRSLPARWPVRWYRAATTAA